MASDPNKETSTSSGYATTSQLAAQYKITPGRMRAILSQLKLSPADRKTGRGGEHVYKKSTVAAAMKKRPGQGARTDL